jgi:MarR family 2-MHQ and catechol resistance regulon transcriptional repressor
MTQVLVEMSLEQDIKQEKGFASEHHKAVVNIMFTEAWLRSQMSDILKPYDLTLQQYNVLRILRGSNPKPLSTSCIRDRMLDKMSDASRIVDRLFKKSLLDRKISATDKRLVDVFIAEEGLKVLSQIDGRMAGFNESLNLITEDEARVLNGVLDRLRG